MAPQARRDQLLTQQVGDELVIYDEQLDVAHRLNPPAATVWRLADGERTISDLTELLQEEFGGSVDESLVYVALEELQHANLLLSGLPPEMEPVSRRAMIATLATLLPVVASIKLHAQQADMPLCSYTALLSTGSLNQPAGGGSLGFQVSGFPIQGITCSNQWTAVSNQPWAIPSPPSGSGITSTTVTVTVLANTGAQRSATVTIAGSSFTITQAAGSATCVFTVSPTAVNLASTAGSVGSVKVTGNTPPCGNSWTAASAGFVTVAPTTGSDSGPGTTVTLTANSANTTNAARTQAVTIAGQTVTVTQNAAASPCGQNSASEPGTTSTATVTRTVQLGKTSGTTTFSWDNGGSIPDQMTVLYQGQPLFTTGCVATAGSKAITYSGSSTEMVVEIKQNCGPPSGSTAWSFSFTCP